MTIRCPDCEGTGRDGCEDRYPYQRLMCHRCVGSGQRELAAVLADWARDLRYKYSIAPSHRIRRSRLGSWVARLFRKTCYNAVTVTFGDGVFCFTCHKKRWHKGDCEDAVPSWSCVIPRKPGYIRFDEVNRRKYNILQKAKL